MITWGVDVAVAHVAIAVVEDGRVLQVDHARLPGSWSRGMFPDRTAALYDLARRTMDDIADVHPPALVLVEQPTGKFNAPTLMGAWGVVTAAAVRVAGRKGGVVAWATPPAWRSAAKAGKNKADALRTAAAAGYEGADEDIADAVCIAIAAQARIAQPA